MFALRHPVRSGSLWLTHLGALGCNALLIVSAWVLGRRTLAWMGALPSGTGSRFLFSTGLGLVLLTYLTLGLGLAGALRLWIGWVLLLVPLIVFFRETRACLDDVRSLTQVTEPVSWGTAGLFLALMPFVVATLWLSLAPASAHDALVYHLNIPKHYVAGHRVAPLPLNVYSNMPHNLEILLTLAYQVGGEPAARVLDFVMRLLVCAGAFALARRSLPVPGALLAALLFLLNPVTTSARTVGNIDLGMAFFFVLAVLAVLRFREHSRAGDLWLAALFSGYLLGCKYTGVFYAGSVMIFGVAAARGLSARAWGVTAILFVAPIAPWLVKNLTFTGNPVYPLLSSWFPSREWSSPLGQQLVRWQQSMGMGRGIVDYLLLPWNIAVEGQMGRNYRFFDGTLSALPLAFAPFLVLMRNRRAWVALLGLCAIPFVGWAAVSQQLRFLIPLLPMTAVVTAGIIWQVDREVLGSDRAVFRTFGVILALVSMVVFQIPSLARNGARALPVVAGDMPRDVYLAESVQPYAAIGKANEILPSGAKILMVWENRGYYLERPYLADSFFEASQIASLAAQSGNPATFVQSLKRDGITHILYNHGLGQFFERLYPPEYGVFLRDLVSNHLEPMYSERDVTLYRIKD
jgi:4-amino-4-deoxy-L-arabinose transferase-like glycosyltransferase